MKAKDRVIAVLMSLALLAGTRRAMAQITAPPPTDPDVNKVLRVQLDRTTIRAFEPVYLVLTAEQYATGADAEVQIRRGDEAFQAVTIPAKEWTKSETPGRGLLPYQRRGTILQFDEQKTGRRWLFPVAGDYKIRVKTGPDSTTLSLTVTAPDAGEQKAWESLGDRRPRKDAERSNCPFQGAPHPRCRLIARKLRLVASPLFPCQLLIRA